MPAKCMKTAENARKNMKIPENRDIVIPYHEHPKKILKKSKKTPQILDPPKTPKIIYSSIWSYFKTFSNLKKYVLGVKKSILT